MSRLGDTALRFGTVSVGYGGRCVVGRARLSVRAGEIVGLIGPNGAGKSTLLRAVTRDAQVISGAIEICGLDASGIQARERARLVGVVPQQVSVGFSIAAREFVEMGRHPHLPRFGHPTEADRRAVDRALDLTDTAHLSDQPVDALSGGDLQRLALAQALATEPRVLLLDEATAHLDLNHRMQVLDLVHALADEGLAVLAVFHDLDLAARYADRIAVVADGGLGDAGAPTVVLTAEMLRAVFGVRAVVGTDPITGSVAVTPVLREGAVRDAGRRARIHVVGGAGSAAPLLRRLVLAGLEVTAGALNAGDADALVAEALGVRFALIPPFAPMDSAAAIHGAQLAETADVVVVGPVPFGHGNIDNLLIAVRAGKPLVLMGAIDDRDFTGGAADSYWIEALASGAVVVPDADGAERAVLEIVRPTAP
ncbi:MAG: ABC transporter ATP-binding protein [Coriobacteriia bacterium]|nr:ABC transporter ATP-binding protein [Coriobacteriia bacterium]